MINDRVLYMEDICLSCPCYLSLQSLLQLARIESYYCCLEATALATAATAPADEDLYTVLYVEEEEEEESFAGSLSSL